MTKNKLKDILSIIIPTKNEEHTIGEVIEKCKRFSNNEVLVIDGDSKDRTCEIARHSGAAVYTEDGGGKGLAMRLGAKKAKGDILLFIDGDGSHEPEDIPKLIRPIIEDNADMVITSRGRGGSDELHGDFLKFIRLICSSIITLVINMRFGSSITDSQNGFRAIKKSIFRELSLKEKSFAIEQEMLMKCLKKGKRIIEIPSHEYARKSGKSRINLWGMTPRYAWSLLRGLF